MLVGGVEWDFKFSFSGQNAAQQAQSAVENLERVVISLESELKNSKSETSDWASKLREAQVSVSGLRDALNAFLANLGNTKSNIHSINNSIAALVLGVRDASRQINALYGSIAQLDTRQISVEPIRALAVASALANQQIRELVANSSTLMQIYQKSGGLATTGTGLQRSNRTYAYDMGSTTNAPQGQQLAISYQQTGLAVSGLQRNVEQLTEAIEKDKKAQKSKAATNEDLASTFDLVSTAVGTFLAALGLDQLYQAIQTYTVLAGRVENLGTILRNVGTNAGLSRGDISNLENQIKSLGITTQKARESLALLAQGEIDLGEGAKLARVAQDAAVIAGINSSEAFERIVQSIQRTNTWMLRNLGILINLNNVYREYAITHGRVTTTLSTHEKQELLMQEVLRKGVAIQGTYESALGDVYKQYTSLDRVVEEAQVKLGQQYLPLWKQVVDVTWASVEAFKESNSSAQAFVAATGAAIVAFLGLATAAGTATVAVTAYNAVMATAMGPQVLAGIAVASLLAGAYVFQQAQIENAARALRDHLLQIEANAAATVRLIHVYSDLKKLQEKGPLSDADKTVARRLTEDAAGLLASNKKTAGIGLELLAQDPGNIDVILAKIRSANKDVTKTVAELRANAQKEFEDAKKIIDLKADAVREVVPLEGRSFGSLATRKETTDEARNRLIAGRDALFDYQKTSSFDAELKKLREAEAAYQSIESTITAIEIQEFKKREKAQETAFNLALRAINQFNTARKQLYQDAASDIFDEFQNEMDNLSNNVMTAEEIKADMQAELLQKTKELARTRDENIAKNPSDKTKLEIQYQSQVLALQEQLRIDELDKLAQREQTLKALDAVTGKRDLLIQRELRQIGELRRLRESREGGVDPKLAEGREKLLELDRQRTELLEKYAKDREAIAQREKELGETPGDTTKGLERLNQDKEALRQAEAASEGRYKEERLKAFQDLTEREKELIKERTEAEEKAAERTLELEQRITDKIIDLQEKLVAATEKAEELRQNAIRQTAELRAKAEADAIKQAENALGKLEKGVKDALDKRVKDIEMWREFGKLLQKGVNPIQARAQVAEKFKVPPVGVQRVEDFIKRMREVLEARKQKLEDADKKRKEADDARHKKELERQLDEAIKQRDRIIKALEELKLLGIQGKAGEKDLLADIKKAVEELRKIKEELRKDREKIEKGLKDPFDAGSEKRIEELEKSVPKVSTTPGQIGQPPQSGTPAQPTTTPSTPAGTGVAGPKGSGPIGDALPKAVEPVKQEVEKVVEKAEVIDKDLQEMIDILKKIVPKEAMDLEKMPTNKQIEEIAKLLEALATGKIVPKPPEDLPLGKRPRVFGRPDTRRQEAESKWYQEFEAKLEALLDKFGNKKPVDPKKQKAEAEAAKKAKDEAAEAAKKAREAEDFTKSKAREFEKARATEKEMQEYKEALDDLEQQVIENEAADKSKAMRDKLQQFFKDKKQHEEAQEDLDRQIRENEEYDRKSEEESWKSRQESLERARQRMPEDSAPGDAPPGSKLKPNPSAWDDPIYNTLRPLFGMPELNREASNRAEQTQKLVSKAITAQKQLRVAVAMQSETTAEGFGTIAQGFRSLAKGIVAEQKEIKKQVDTIKSEHQKFTSEFTSQGLD